MCYILLSLIKKSLKIITNYVNFPKILHNNIHISSYDISQAAVFKFYFLEKYY